MYTLGQAAKAAGYSKSTLSKAVKSGKLSAKRLEDGSYNIDPAELDRWCSSNGHRNGKNTQLSTPISNEINTEKIPNDSALQKEVEVLREMIEELKSERDYARDQASEWKEQAAKVTALLDGTATANRKGFWARVFG